MRDERVCTIRCRKTQLRVREWEQTSDGVSEVDAVAAGTVFGSGALAPAGEAVVDGFLCIIRV